MKVVNLVVVGCEIEFIIRLRNHGESHPHCPAALISDSAVSPGAGQIGKNMIFVHFQKGTAQGN